MSEHFADRLLQAVARKKTPVCIGIDPVYDRLPQAIRQVPDFGDEHDTESALDAILEFCRQVIRIVAPVVPAVKINSAYFERYYGEGLDAYMELVQEAASLDLVVIGDCKRGDVGHSGELYARAHLANPDFANLSHLRAPDAITVQSFMGSDGLRPFLGVCREQHKGIFALVQTSNESATEVQGMRDGDGLSLSEHLARSLAALADDDGLVGRSGYSCLGAVVSPRNIEMARRLRVLMPHSIFLVPGYGAQGLTAADVASCFAQDARGAIVNASRSVIYAFDNPAYEHHGTDRWLAAVEEACRQFATDVARAVGLQ